MVLAQYENGIGKGEIIEGDRAFTDANAATPLAS